ncbi:cyclase family protein [Amnibacterium sp.]|uniref:cyclase family protein n=1 Tax=Amnibacterium sp. TaxID=1872496 RepID=UPI00262599EC|nr:cyclase family protein [Amnibacterium sp.]MCU1472898.1 cyclase family protein [Amnibacterium sp.]
MDEQMKALLDLRVVDLTLLLAEELPAAWAKHMPYQQKTFNYFEARDDQVSPLKSEVGPYQTRWLLIDEHTGTHVDAPAHFIPESKTGLPGAAEAGSITVEQLPLRQLMGAAVVVEIPQDLPGSGPGVSPIITVEFLAAWEEENDRFAPGDIVLFRTGWDRHYVRGEAGLAYSHHPLVTRTTPGWPAPDADAMRLLMDRGVTCVGTDGASMGSSHAGAAVHTLALGARVAFIEALGHLHQLPVRGAVFCFAPLKVARGTGAPGRAFAWLPDGPASAS